MTGAFAVFRATSLPSSPVEGSQRPVARTSSNPYFVPMKEPPKYDEVVKNKPAKVNRFPVFLLFTEHKESVCMVEL